jgi:unsaturated chondroitin disaccharide hydrolase
MGSNQMISANKIAFNNAQDADLEVALTNALQTIRQTIPKMGMQQPRIGQADLTYIRCTDSDWVNSFWSGQLWLAFAHTGEATFADAARSQQAYFAGRLERPHSLDHDLGFLYSLSVVAEYKITGNLQARELGLKAADYLVKRYNPHGQFIQAWNVDPQSSWQEQQNRRGQVIIDCMENLGLLYWASSQTNQKSYQDIAISHALTVSKFLVRADGSTYHTFIFNPENGEPLGGRTAQGYADDSCWSRGQAWAIHGFALAYLHTKLPVFLETAQRLADYVLAQLANANDLVPYWDYQLPENIPHYRDSSAAAITAAGLFLLSNQLGANSPHPYRTSAYRILAELVRHYTTAGNIGAEGLLLHGASHVPAGLTDNMLPYGDYFYLEALLRSLGRTEFFW